MVTLPDTAAGSGVLSLSLDELLLSLEPLDPELPDEAAAVVGSPSSLPQAAAISRKLTQMAGSIRCRRVDLRTKNPSFGEQAI